MTAARLNRGLVEFVRAARHDWTKTYFVSFVCAQQKLAMNITIFQIVAAMGELLNDFYQMSLMRQNGVAFMIKASNLNLKCSCCYKKVTNFKVMGLCLDLCLDCTASYEKRADELGAADDGWPFCAHCYKAGFKFLCEECSLIEDNKMKGI